MRATMAIGLLACATAMGDETISTFDNDEWSVSALWEKVGQTMMVPEGSTVLDSFSFMIAAWGDNEGGTYNIKVYDWDADEKHVVASPTTSTRA